MQDLQLWICGVFADDGTEGDFSCARVLAQLAVMWFASVVLVTETIASVKG